MNFVDDLLIILGSYSKGYKLMRKRMHGYTGPADFSRIKKNFHVKDSVLRVTLSRLKRRGLVKNPNRIWSVTKEGITYLRDRIDYLIRNQHVYLGHRRRDKTPGKKKDVIIAFDVPERFKSKRDWLRIELAALGFSQLQKSVWIGPSPLPEDFLEAVDVVGILDCLRFFRVSEYDIV